MSWGKGSTTGACEIKNSNSGPMIHIDKEDEINNSKEEKRKVSID